MSRNRARTISCSKCGKSFDVLVWDSINVDTYPEQRERIKNGSFNRYLCPDCGYSMIVQYKCLYNDMSNSKQVFVFPNNFEENLEVANRYFTLLEKEELKVVASIAANCIFRAVHDFSELREKVNMWDSGFDDAAMEIYKAMARTWIEAKEKPVSRAFFSCEDGNNEIEVLFEDGTAGAVDFVPELYRDIMEKYGSELKEATEDRIFNVIDFNFATDFMSRILFDKDQAISDFGEDIHNDR